MLGSGPGVRLQELLDELGCPGILPLFLRHTGLLEQCLPLLRGGLDGCEPCLCQRVAFRQKEKLLRSPLENKAGLVSNRGGVVRGVGRRLLPRLLTFHIRQNGASWEEKKKRGRGRNRREMRPQKWKKERKWGRCKPSGLSAIFSTSMLASSIMPRASSSEGPVK